MTLTAPEPAIPKTDAPTVIGLDTSLTATGIASSRGWCEVIGYKRPRSKDPGITQLPHAERLAAMRDLLDQVTTAIGCPDLAVMELPAPSRSGGGAHERGWFWWEIYRHLTTSYIPVGLLTPNQRGLYATGKGQAGKGAVVDAVARRFAAWSTEGDDNAADAVTLMAAGLDWLGHPITPMPKTHRAAIDKAVWPDLTGATP
ncbi:hypothetical protein ACFV2X_38220 [Streptomyces sp. NPDC059679]|uniref:hypothetical protein n=1 Tax=Streptomyces sp. NPDC059679 TaxID=3346903 RepID=UPI00369AB557